MLVVLAQMRKRLRPVEGLRDAMRAIDFWRWLYLWLRRGQAHLASSLSIHRRANEGQARLRFRLRVQLACHLRTVAPAIGLRNAHGSRLTGGAVRIGISGPIFSGGRSLSSTSSSQSPKRILAVSSSQLSWTSA